MLSSFKTCWFLNAVVSRRGPHGLSPGGSRRAAPAALRTRTDAGSVPNRVCTKPECHYFLHPQISQPGVWYLKTLRESHTGKHSAINEVN